MDVFLNKVETLMEANSGKYVGWGHKAEHAHQVTVLALRLYDGMKPWHQLKAWRRTILWAAAMLHDIGMVKCQKEHSWQSGKMILEHRHKLHCDIDQVTPEAIATVAALHDTEHVFDPVNDPLGEVKASIAGLWPGGKIPRELQLLAGILRVADGLDHGSCQHVKDIIVGRDKIKVQAAHNPSVEIKHAAGKSALLFAILHHTWRFEHVV